MGLWLVVKMKQHPPQVDGAGQEQPAAARQAPDCLQGRNREQRLVDAAGPRAEETGGRWLMHNAAARHMLGEQKRHAAAN
jgi:hypothetical protein